MEQRNQQQKQKLKIRLLSDLHLEIHDLDKQLTFKSDADVVILAGDIGNPHQSSYESIINKLSLLHSKVLVISGNHEYYSQTNDMPDIDDQIQQICDDDDDIHFLQMRSIIYERVKFIGCTLWSEVKDSSLTKYMNDFNKIKSNDNQPLTISEYNDIHTLHRKWLETELTKPKTNDYDKVCVITHHLPSYSLIDPQYTDEPTNCFFATDVNTQNADIWCYGHTHKANKTEINGTKFYCNPRGYPGEKTEWNKDFVFEI
jgi:predicted phosphodiesterase